MRLVLLAVGVITTTAGIALAFASAEAVFYPVISTIFYIAAGLAGGAVLFGLADALIRLKRIELALGTDRNQSLEEVLTEELAPVEESVPERH